MVANPKYQIIVVGAGPAGCAAAIHALQAGLSVLIIEARPFPRPRPGETLHPGIEPLFQQLGIIDKIYSDGYQRPTGFYTRDKKEFAFNPYHDKNPASPWYGWLIPREEMDTCLLNRACSLGAVFIQATVQLKFMSANQIILMAGQQTFYSDYILDGTGHNFWLSRQLGNLIQKMSRQLVTYYGTCRGEYPEAINKPCFIREKSSWTWIAQLKPNCYQWTHLDYKTQRKEKNFRPADLKALIPIGANHSRDVTWRLTSSPAARNYYCLGDAAFITDPSSSKGVLRAVMSGIMAAHLISNTLKRTIDSESASSFYNNWTRTWFKHEFMHLKESIKKY